MTVPFTLQAEGWYLLAPGRYVVLGAPRTSGVVSHPDHAEDLYVDAPADDGRLAIVTEPDSGLPFLVAPVGSDRSGGITRTAEVAGRSILMRGFLGVAPVSEQASPRQNPNASACELYAFLEVRERGSIELSDDGLRILVDDQAIDIDLWRPAVFDFEGIVLDMEDEDVAGRLGYGTDGFEESVDEHGIFLDVKVAALRLRGGGETAAALADRLDRTGRNGGIFYHC